MAAGSGVYVKDKARWELCNIKKLVLDKAVYISMLVLVLLEARGNASSEPSSRTRLSERVVADLLQRRDVPLSCGR